MELLLFGLLGLILACIFAYMQRRGDTFNKTPRYNQEEILMVIALTIIISIVVVFLILSTVTMTYEKFAGGIMSFIMTLSFSHGPAKFFVSKFSKRSM